MDKLRALEYCLAAADGGSLSAAARRLDVTVAAVSKQIAAFEQALGFRIFERHASGLTVTGVGAAFLENGRETLDRFAEAEDLARTAASGLSGTVVVGAQPAVAQEVLCAALPQFHAMHPDIQLDLRYFLQPTDGQLAGVDVLLAIGWPQGVGDLVSKVIGATAFVICAAPDYWARHGRPTHPSELAAHDCLCIRSRTGTVMDLWRFQRGAEQVSVPVKGWLVSDNSHRDTVLRTAVAGGGVMRLIDWNALPGKELSNGRLVPVLEDWQSLDVPGVNIHYPPNVRRIPRVRAFIDFATRLFEDIEQLRANRQPATASPDWLRGRRTRASRSG
ncbi:MAG TPA: LysR family transcriptional regulator [Aquabacterium sp.]|nr:LysR family transcriptional regulator [Aquabacterium sp.]HQC96653.1 LysR family transcriptional regulator [Aquabacterium sp.]